MKTTVNNDLLQVGTMVRMAGVIGGLRVEEIDREGDRVICIDGSNEKHTYNSLDYFTAKAEEIRIPEWLRICQYFLIGPQGVERNRVLCTDIIPCSDQEKPVIIVYSDYEGKERKIFLSSGLDEVNTDFKKAADIVKDKQEKPGHVNTAWTTGYTPDDFQKLRSRYEIADEDRDIMGCRFHSGNSLWTIDVFVSDYAGNESHALIYILTGEGAVRANVLSLEHLRQTLTEAKGWHKTA